MQKIWLSVPLFALSVAFATASAAPVTHYTERHVNSGEYVYTADYQATENGTQRDTSGAAVEYGISGTQTWAFGNGAGGYLFRDETSDVYARADLATGALKARSMLTHGANSEYSAAPPAPGSRFSSARAGAAFADSFRFASSEGSSYLWQQDEQFRFGLSVHGDVVLPEGHTMPEDGLGTKTGAWLTLDIYRPGGLQALTDYYARYIAPEPDEDFDDWLADLNVLWSEVESRKITSGWWCIGPNISTEMMCPESVALDENGLATIDFAFAPGGDFEFVLELNTLVSIDLAFENVSGKVDFSHTVNAGFTAPEGAEVYSASGLFPQTRANEDPPASVPEPAPLGLLLLGALLGATGWSGRRRTRSPA